MRVAGGIDDAVAGGGALLESLPDMVGVAGHKAVGVFVAAGLARVAKTWDCSRRGRGLVFR